MPSAVLETAIPAIKRLHSHLYRPFIYIYICCLPNGAISSLCHMTSSGRRPVPKHVDEGRTRVNCFCVTIPTFMSRDSGEICKIIVKIMRLRAEIKTGHLSI